MSFHVKVPKGYDLLSSVHSWIYPDIQPVPECTGEGFLSRIYTVGNRHVALIIRQTKPGKSLNVSHSETDIVKQNLKAMLERTLSLTVNIDGAILQIRNDPIIAHLAPRVAGIRPYMSPTPYEALIKTIIQQQVSYKSANIFTRRMILGLCRPISFQSQLLYYFPDASTLTNIGIDGLRKFGFGYKAEYIHHTANLIATNELDIDSLVGAPYEKVLETLAPIHGIGEWTVLVLSLAGLGNFNVFAFNDLVIQKILGNLYNQGEKMNTNQVQEHAQNWGKSGTMVLYLLMCAEVLGLINT
ncbi:MAG: DNA-3-methyladenine glycosylase family protein [Candidatus Thorarchaeota archaeon SMTZ1-45]|nr:MAG: hypothetical protein AM325_06700 [Candidatus Thorarchaeota archaeon SMTZ1-45]